MSVRVIDTEATSRNLRKMFADSGLTPRKVQNALQLESIQAVYKWISPKYNTIPSLDNLLQLSKLMDCSIEEMLVVREIP